MFIVYYLFIRDNKYLMLEYKKEELKKRIECAIEIRTNLENNGLEIAEYQEIELFINIMNTWVKDGISINGEIEIKSLGRILKYNFNRSKPVVKFTKI